MYLLTTFITMLMSNKQSSFQVPRFEECTCVIKFHVARLMNTLMKMASKSRSNLAVIETVFFHSI